MSFLKKFSWPAKRQEEMEKVVATTIDSVISRELNGLRKRLTKYQDLEALQAETLRLREQIETLKIEKDRQEEKHAKTQREIEHKLGLHKVQVAFESNKARDEAVLEVERKNLDKDVERFEGQMKFEREQTQQQIEHLRSIVEPLLAALPKAEILARIGGVSNSNGE